MKDSFKSSSVMGLNWIYDSDSLPGRMSWKMPPRDKTEWAFERSQDTASARISAQLINFFKLKSRPAVLESSPASGGQRKGNKVFEAPGGCKDKTAHPAHHGAACVLFFWLPPPFLLRKKAFHPRWHWPFQYLGTTTLPVSKVPIDGWCATAISQPIPQPQITVPARSNHNVEKRPDCTPSNAQIVA